MPRAERRRASSSLGRGARVGRVRGASRPRVFGFLEGRERAGGEGIRAGGGEREVAKTEV